jgi:hypothetical protein
MPTNQSQQIKMATKMVFDVAHQSWMKFKTPLSD